MFKGTMMMCQERWTVMWLEEEWTDGHDLEKADDYTGGRDWD